MFFIFLSNNLLGAGGDGTNCVGRIYEGGKLKVKETVNADTPMASGTPCLLALDVWEHAYYLDYKNVRKDHVDVVVEKLLNWDFASANFKKSR